MSAESLEKNNTELLALYKQASLDFDKQVVYIAGGGLALSIGFVKDIVKVASSGSLGFLMATWAVLALTLLVNLISYMVSTNASNAMMMSNQHLVRHEAAEKEEDKEDEMNKAFTFQQQAVANSKWVQRLNMFSVILTAAGIFAFLLFVSLNLASMGKQHDSDSDKPQTGQPQGPEEIRGMPLPSTLTTAPQRPSSPTAPDSTPSTKPNK